MDSKDCKDAKDICWLTEYETSMYKWYENREL